MKLTEQRSLVAPEDAKELARRLEQWRRDRRLTQAELAEVAGITQSQLSRLLSGKFSKTNAAVLRLMQASGVGIPAPNQKKFMRAKLERELERCWDGSESHALLIMRLLKAARTSGVSHR